MKKSSDPQFGEFYYRLPSVAQADMPPDIAQMATLKGQIEAEEKSLLQGGLAASMSEAGMATHKSIDAQKVQFDNLYKAMTASGQTYTPPKADSVHAASVAIVADPLRAAELGARGVAYGAVEALPLVPAAAADLTNLVAKHTVGAMYDGSAVTNVSTYIDARLDAVADQVGLKVDTAAAPKADVAARYGRYVDTIEQGEGVVTNTGKTAGGFVGPAVAAKGFSIVADGVSALAMPADAGEAALAGTTLKTEEAVQTVAPEVQAARTQTAAAQTLDDVFNTTLADAAKARNTERAQAAIDEKTAEAAATAKRTAEDAAKLADTVKPSVAALGQSPFARIRTASAAFKAAAGEGNMSTLKALSVASDKTLSASNKMSILAEGGRSQAATRIFAKTLANGVKGNDLFLAEGRALPEDVKAILNEALTTKSQNRFNPLANLYNATGAKTAYVAAFPLRTLGADIALPLVSRAVNTVMTPVNTALAMTQKTIGLSGAAAGGRAMQGFRTGLVLGGAGLVDEFATGGAARKTLAPIFAGATDIAEDVGNYVEHKLPRPVQNVIEHVKKNPLTTLAEVGGGLGAAAVGLEALKGLGANMGSMAELAMVGLIIAGVVAYFENDRFHNQVNQGMSKIASAFGNATAGVGPAIAASIAPPAHYVNNHQYSAFQPT